MIQYINKSIHAAAAGLLIPVWLAAASFAVENRRSGEIIKLAVHPGEQSSYLDLKELAGILGDSLYWEQPGERLVWVAGEGSFVFEDRVTFFAFKGESYQLVAPCLLHGPRFLVPLQAAVEYLPGFYPERFVYNKLNNRLVDHREKVIAAGKETIAREKETPRAALPQRSVKTDGRSYRISTVVIDPGHGGRDPGAIGRRYKLREKDLVLDISKKLAANLKKSSELKVILTREKDVLIPLIKRGRIANESGAGLFISIHCNANRKRSVRGTSTYFLDAAKTDEERATAMLENASLKYEAELVDTENLDKINLILQDMAQNEFLRESKDLCAFIQGEMVRIRNLPDKGIRQAGFAVLKGAFMPAALVETAFVSNHDDEKLLNSRKFRQKAADSIARGILKYIDYYHKKLAEEM